MGSTHLTPIRIDSSRCTRCERGGDFGPGYNPTQYGGADSRVVILVGSAWRERYGKYPVPDLIMELSRLSGLAMHNPLIIPVVRCGAKYNPTNAQVQTCSSYYLNTILHQHPRDLVICLGRIPQFALTGSGVNISKKYGLVEDVWVDEWDEAPFRVMYGPDPEYIIFGQTPDSKDTDRLMAVFQKAVKVLDGSFVPMDPPTTVTLDSERAAEMLERIADDDCPLSLDTETTSLRWNICELLGFSFALSEDIGYWVPADQITHRVKAALACILSDEDRTIYMHNAKYDAHVLTKHVGPVRAHLHDTMLASHQTDENLSASLKGQAIMRLGATNWDEALNLGTVGKAKKVDFAKVNPVVLGKYAAEDAAWTFRLARHFSVKEREESSFIYRNGLEVVRALHSAEQYGIFVAQENRTALYDHTAAIQEKAYGQLQPLAGVVVDEHYYEDLAEHEAWRQTVIDTIGKDPKKGAKNLKWKQALRDAGRWIDEPEAPKWFNPNASGQIGNVLFNVMGYPPLGKTKADNFKTDKKTLEALTKMQTQPPGGPEFLQHLREYKRATKINQLMAQYVVLTDEDGRLRCNFKPTGTISGRLSSEGPNLQQVPKVIRPGFKAPEGYVLIELDFSQAEVRCGAALSGDPVMLKTIADADEDQRRFEQEMREYIVWKTAIEEEVGSLAEFEERDPEGFLEFKEAEFYWMDPPRPAIDVHRAIAALVFEVDPVDVTDDQRTKAKAVTFGLMYGKTLQNIEEMFGAEVAKKLWDSFFGVFTVFGAWITKIHAKVRREAQVTTPFGRTRHLTAALLKSKSLKRLYEEALRQAVNFLVQSTASEITLRAIVAIHHMLVERGYDAKFILTVHDSIAIEVRQDIAEEVAALCIEIMERPTGSKILDAVQMRADCTITEYWGGKLSIDKLDRLIYGEAPVDEPDLLDEEEEDEYADAA